MSCLPGLSGQQARVQTQAESWRKHDSGVHSKGDRGTEMPGVGCVPVRPPFLEGSGDRSRLATGSRLFLSGQLSKIKMCVFSRALPVRSASAWVQARTKSKKQLLHSAEWLLSGSKKLRGH